MHDKKAKPKMIKIIWSLMQSGLKIIARLNLEAGKNT